MHYFHRKQKRRDFLMDRRCAVAMEFRAGRAVIDKRLATVLLGGGCD
jgi:hypothetical protein